jgi:MFS family permease
LAILQPAGIGYSVALAMTETQEPAAPAPAEEKIPLRTELAVYGVGTFSTTAHFMLLVIIPIWAIEKMQIPTGLLLGFVLGCRPLLSLFLSIHAGTMMDRIGTRRVLLFFGLLSLTTPLMYPAFPFIAALIVIQLLSGLCDSIGWMGAQTLVGQVLKGRTSYAARMGAVIRIGHIGGPPLVGAAWDYAGPWAAFSLVGLCGLCFLGSVLMLPPTQTDGSDRAPTDSPADTPKPRAGFKVRDFIPHPSDYIASFKLLAAPAVAITVMLGMMVHIGNNIQSTFFIVWLREYVGVPATLIGMLISISSAAAAAGSLWAIPLRRHIRSFWLLWCSVLTSLVAISITPLVGSAPVVGAVKGTLGSLVELSPLIAAYIAFCVIACVRSAGNGVHQPLVITLMLRTVGPNDKGKAIGLRGTMNRVTSMIGPLLLGALAGTIGLEYGFYVIGIMASLMMFWLAWLMLRHPEIHAVGEGPAQP